MKEVIDLLKCHLKKDDSIIVGCSGGSDSMCLLSLLEENFKDVKIICAHVNHKVRIESEEEYKHVKMFCEQKAIIFEGIEIPQVFNNNFEAEARKFRYDFYNKLCIKYSAKYIMTAHHSDDLIETILMRISRGSTLSGYAGIKLIDGKYFRPLLLLDKNKILDYVEEHNIKYYEDYTNKLDDHTRNRYRHYILPQLKKECNTVGDKYLKFSQELQAYDGFVNQYIFEKELIYKNRIFVDKLLKESDFIKRKTIEVLVKNIQKEDILDINDKNAIDIINLIKSKKSNIGINLSNGYVAKKQYNELTIEKDYEVNGYEMIFDGKFSNDLWDITQVKSTEDTSNFVLRLNSKEVKLPLIIRTRKEKDYIKVKNSGVQKIKKIFIDNKVLMGERKVYPIVTDSDNRILWIPGIKKSEFDKEKNEKYDIILYSERKEIDE